MIPIRILIPINMQMTKCSVADPHHFHADQHHFHADPDLTYHSVADPDPDFYSTTSQPSVLHCPIETDYRSTCQKLSYLHIEFYNTTSTTDKSHCTICNEVFLESLRFVLTPFFCLFVPLRCTLDCRVCGGGGGEGDCAILLKAFHIKNQ
jgi:hypothetical protein